ncbi:MAG: hypothetical protein CM15mP105_3010 [Methanobacteriota archaeon]|nr:MAG: hypothetical protein CM15mP105_3010 [Euryarchaeota archaeon]
MTIGESGTGDLSIELNSDDLEDGRYIVRIGILASDSDSKEWSEEEIVEAVASPGSLVSYKELEIELHTTSSSSRLGPRNSQGDGEVRRRNPEHA